MVDLHEPRQQLDDTGSGAEKAVITRQLQWHSRRPDRRHNRERFRYAAETPGLYVVLVQQFSPYCGRKLPMDDGTLRNATPCISGEKTRTSQGTVLVFLIRVFTRNDHAECPCLQRSVKLVGLAPRAVQDRLGGFGDPVDGDHQTQGVF